MGLEHTVSYSWVTEMDKEIQEIGGIGAFRRVQLLKLLMRARDWANPGKAEESLEQYVKDQRYPAGAL